MTEYDYQAHVVTGAEYDQISLGSPFRGGVVVEGCGGLENDCLIITAHEAYAARQGMKLLTKLPIGWRTYLVGDKVVAIHPSHSPRIIALADIKSTPFDEWPNANFGPPEDYHG